MHDGQRIGWPVRAQNPIKNCSLQKSLTCKNVLSSKNTLELYSSQIHRQCNNFSHPKYSRELRCHCVTILKSAYFRYLRHREIPPILFIRPSGHCLTGPHFQLNDKFYEQTSGTAIGPSVSPIVDNIWMEYFETQTLRETCNRPTIQYKYADDCFVVWPHGRDELCLLLNRNKLILLSTK